MNDNFQSRVGFQEETVESSIHNLTADRGIMCNNVYIPKDHIKHGCFDV